MFSFRQFATVRAIAEQGTLIAAAGKLAMTPAALTARLKQLEEEVGVRLFDRLPAGMRLTEAGAIALETAARLDRELKDFSERMAVIRTGSGGRLSVVAVSTAKYFAPRLIAAFKHHHPGAELRFLIGNRNETIETMRRFDAEIALTGRPPADLPAEKAGIGPHPYIIVAPPFHPLAKMRRIPKEALANDPFLFREEGSGTRAMFEYFIGDIAVRRAQVGIELGSNETIKQAAMAGLGIALISAHTVAAEVQDGRLVCLDVQGLPIIRQWFVVNRTDRVLSPVARVFKAFVIERGAHFLPRLVTGSVGDPPPTILPPEA